MNGPDAGRRDRAGSRQTPRDGAVAGRRLDARECHHDRFGQRLGDILAIPYDPLLAQTARHGAGTVADFLDHETAAGGGIGGAGARVPVQKRREPVDGVGASAMKPPSERP